MPARATGRRWTSIWTIFARSNGEFRRSKNTTRAAKPANLPDAPVGVPDSWEEHVKLMFDLQVLAFQADVTRVSAFKMSRDVSQRVWPQSGVRTAFHARVASRRQSAAQSRNSDRSTSITSAWLPYFSRN